ncbi:transporter substrate-binding domain-containing protein [Krasilnikoviella flava]|uniref:Polar amino acid transport system substrate-binding protein n=1 Tax=Krasilnikoviella flava TaxID=526729 RepID=A0A1T5IHT0_9MICO|nr:transporter substrate-binding domain-containing protein [Krasilnikoviella flava]SKC38734.1 polar amino acid transport system substrate-binding protein [Krasilnikoviella flava]
MSSTRTTKRRRAYLAAGSVLTMTALAACSSVDEGGSGDGAGSTLQAIQDAGTVNVAFNGEKPYSYMDGDELTGATIALDKEIFGALGVDDVEGTETQWDSLIPGLTANRYDTVSAGMSILPDRCAQAAFAEPTIMYTTAFLVPEGNPEGLTDWQSVEGSDLTIAVTSGAIEDGYAKKTGVKTITVGDSTDGLNAVVTGRADAFALTGISIRALAESTDEPVEATDAFVATIDGVAQIGAGAEVFRKGDTELLEAYNEELAKINGDKEKWLEIMEPFGFTEAEFPPEGLTAEMLCEGDLAAITDELGLDS